jgi:hypothetical protein
MDARRFDAIARTLTIAGSRRRALTGLVSGTLGLALGATSIADVAARKKCPPCTKRKKGKCKKKLPDGTPCNIGTCQNGECRCNPSCAPSHACGPDSCGGSCGTCIGGACPTGVCDCGSGKEPCQGACVSTCTSSQIRPPGTCNNCCYVNGTPRDVGLSTCVISCCSGRCDPNPSGSGFVCAGTPLCKPCTFDEQCVQGAKCQGDRCVGISGTTLCP